MAVSQRRCGGCGGAAMVLLDEIVSVCPGSVSVPPVNYFSHRVGQIVNKGLLTICPTQWERKLTPRVTCSTPLEGTNIFLNWYVDRSCCKHSDTPTMIYHIWDSYCEYHPCCWHAHRMLATLRARQKQMCQHIFKTDQFRN